ncbi:MAG: hypothetical protein WA825_10145, partial [Steroidobacteraceae bacterium]
MTNDYKPKPGKGIYRRFADYKHESSPELHPSIEVRYRPPKAPVPGFQVIFRATMRQLLDLNHVAPLVDG